MQNLKNVRLPQGNAAGRVVGAVIGGGALLYGASNSLFNVEGGHRAIVFNRISGIKEEVCAERCAPLCILLQVQQLVITGIPDRFMKKGRILCFHGLSGPSFTTFALGPTSSQARLAPKICKW